MNEYGNIIKITFIIIILSILLFLFSGYEKKPLKKDDLTGDFNISNEIKIIDIETENMEISGYKLDFLYSNYSETELEKMAKECEELLKNQILNGNESYRLVTHKLSFPDTIPGYPFNILYIYESELIDYDGNIVCAESFDSILNIILSYDSYKESFSISVHVEPDMDTKNKLKKQDIINNLTSEISDKNAMRERNKNNMIELPGDVNGKEINYYIPAKERNFLYLLLGPVASAFLLWGSRKDAKAKIKKKNETILSEYPKMIQKMSLYLDSGMTIRNIWILICNEEKEKGKTLNPLYEEMQISVNEFRTGIDESTVYKRFGIRISIPEIVRFSALLSQNIKKGNTKLKEQLYEEAKKAFTLRKNMVLKKSEEAGIKLLFPLMMLLLDVMVIIILPAFWSIK